MKKVDADEADYRRWIRRENAVPDLRILPPDALLTRNQLVALSGFSLMAFRKWAKLGRGPKITTVEGRPRYRVEDVRVWIQANRPEPRN
ncbi:MULTISPECIES: helix-turn-helix transcriptional regulator [unclassified Shinella]|uniref:helix-turn-helix transcriptional regulator n=1 Tax=unclassified Shinella TaxID=2643062 RepID=UPI0030C83D0B